MSLQAIETGDSAVYLIHLENKNGMSAGIATAGGRLLYLKVPDKHGNLTDVVGAYSTINLYKEGGNPYFGAIIGRVSNRIRNAEFVLNNKKIKLQANNGNHCLHGGLDGFQTINWQISTLTSNSVSLQHISEAGSCGFPGELTVIAKFELTDQNEFLVEFTYSATEETPVSLTYHPYFNLTGYKEPNILNHRLQLNSDRYFPLIADFTASNNSENVQNTPFDFQIPKTIGVQLAEKNEQLALAFGFDHNFAIKEYSGLIKEAAILWAPSSGIEMKVLTDYPGFQVYTSNYDESEVPGKNSEVFSKHHSVCIEPQFFPNSVNFPESYSPYIQANKKYTKTICYKFSIIK